MHCFETEENLRELGAAIRAFLKRLGNQTNQGVVGDMVDRVFYESTFPLHGD